MSTVVQRAADYARTAHESIDQRRKFTNKPYIVHPTAVAEIVTAVTDDTDMICAASVSYTHLTLPTILLV